MAALAGGLLLLVSYVLVEAAKVASISWLIASLRWISEFLPGVSYLGTLAGTVPLGVLVAHAVNWSTDARKIKVKEVIEYGDELEVKITRAVFGTYSNLQLYMVTLSTGKVYIGLIASGTDPYLERTHLTILKFASGYRTAKHQINVETTYAEVLHGIGKEDSDVPSHVDATDLEVVLPKAKVVQLSKFDPALREYFPDGPDVRGANP